jgi:hypothetical protein
MMTLPCNLLSEASNWHLREQQPQTNTQNP